MPSFRHPPLPSGLQDRPQLVGEGELPRLPVLRRARLQAHVAGREIHLAPLQAEDFTLSPAGDIGEPRDGLQPFR